MIYHSFSNLAPFCSFSAHFGVKISTGYPQILFLNSTPWNCARHQFLSNLVQIQVIYHCFSNLTPFCSFSAHFEVKITTGYTKMLFLNSTPYNCPRYQFLSNLVTEKCYFWIQYTKIVSVTNFYHISLRSWWFITLFQI